MSSQGSDERKAAESQRSLKDFIASSYRLKMWIIGLSLTILVVSFYTLDYLIQTKQLVDQLGWLSPIPFRALGDACFTTLLIGLAYEWFVRRENDEKLNHYLQDVLTSNSKAIMEQIPRSLWTEPQVIRNVLDPTRLDQVVLTALQVRLRDDEMGKDIFNGLLQRSFAFNERWSHYGYKVTLTNISESDVADETRDRYFQAYVEVSYDGRLLRSPLIFTCVPIEQYSEVVRDPRYELRVRFTPSHLFPRVDESVFNVDYCRVGGLDLTLRTEVSPEGRFTVVGDHPELAMKLNTIVTVAYRYRLKVTKHAHLYTIDVSRPTNGVQVEFDYAQTDIAQVRVLDYFVSATPPVVRSSPPHQPHKQEVEVSDWVFPRGGVIFVWALHSEMPDGLVR